MAGISSVLAELNRLKNLGKRPLTEFEQRHAMAQRNAALPVSQGGLGLPPNNTAADRAKAMGFGDLKNPSYHGSLHDIRNIDIGRSSPGGHAGQGFYTTPSAKDASMNYATLKGPDTSDKVISRLEQAENARGIGYQRVTRAVMDRALTPRRAEAVIRATDSGDHLGAVYPVVVKRGKEANAVDEARSAYVGPADEYIEDIDDYRELPDAALHNRAAGVIDDYGVEQPIPLMDARTEGANLGRLWRDVKAENLDAYDEMGEPVSPGGLASEVVKALGADTVTHPTQWRNRLLNIAGEHTIALKPENVRSVFAAFDPMQRHSNDMLGFVDPRLLGGMAIGGTAAAGGGGDYLSEAMAELMAKYKAARAR